MRYKNEINYNGETFIYESNYKIKDSVKQVLQDILLRTSNNIDWDWQTVQNFIDSKKGLDVYSCKLKLSDNIEDVLKFPDIVYGNEIIFLVFYITPDFLMGKLKDIVDNIKKKNNDIEILNHFIEEEKIDHEYCEIKILYEPAFVTPSREMSPSLLKRIKDTQRIRNIKGASDELSEKYFQEAMDYLDIYEEKKKVWSNLQVKTYKEIANMITITQGDELLWVIGTSWVPYARLKHINNKFGKMSCENAHKNYHAPPNERKYVIECEDGSIEEFANVDALIDDGWVLD